MTNVYVHVMGFSRYAAWSVTWRHHEAMATSTPRSGEAAHREAAMPIKPYASAQNGSA